MSRNLRLLSLACLALVTAFAAADERSVQVSTFPTMSVADGRSTITVTAIVRDSNGRAVPNGTSVVFESTLGHFRDYQVQTVNGYARAVLEAGGVPGTAKITVKTPSGPPTTLDYEFVGSRADLSSAREYIEVVTPGYMQYAVDRKIIGAAAPKRGVVVRYRDIEIQADDIQLQAETYLLKARNAHLKIGHFVKDFQELNLTLNARHGYGTTTYTASMWQAIVPFAHGFVCLAQDEKGNWGPPQPKERFGYVEVWRDHVERGTPTYTPGTTDSDPTFAFEELIDSPSSVSAKKAIIFPRRGIQFQRAEIYVANSRLIKLPLYELNFSANTSPLITESFIGVNDNQLALNYPQYLSLQPGLTSLLRLRTGEQYSRAGGTAKGAFLDYELNWNKGDDMEGNVTFAGLLRDDWDLSARQYMRIDDRTSANVQLDVPAFNSLLGSGGASHQFDGFQASLNGNVTRTLRGIQSQAHDVNFLIEKDPTKVGALPVRLYYGLTATAQASRIETDNGFTNFSQQGVGVRFRAQSLPIILDQKSNISAGVTATQLYHSENSSNLGWLANVALNHQFNRSASMTASYDFMKDGYNDAMLGEHRVSLQSTYEQGHASMRLFASRSLDKDRASLYGDLSYSLNQKWRLYSSYTLDRYLGDQYLDYTMGIGYHIGWREIGLVWSNRTQRLGVQFLGATF